MTPARNQAIGDDPLQGSGQPWRFAGSDGAVHPDETYWNLDGQRSQYWIHAADKYIHYQFDTSANSALSAFLLSLVIVHNPLDTVFHYQFMKIDQ